MASRRSKPPPPVDALATEHVRDVTTARVLGSHAQAIRDLQGARSRAVLRSDLEIGINRIRHGLGRAVEGYTLTPTTASASFAHAIDASNPAPDLEIWISVIGAAQPGARIEVY